LTTSAATHPSTLCLEGCNTPDDCGAGNTCNVLLDTAGARVFIGPFSGYCIGTCASDADCIASETCSDVLDPIGVLTAHCVPRCTGVGEIGAASGGCTDDEVCLAAHAGATYGRCELADRFCGAVGTLGLPAASTDCATGWVCDELLASVDLQPEVLGDGHCVRACGSDLDCFTGTTCVTSGPLAGLCRQRCTVDADCAARTTCDETLGLCIEAS